MASMQQSKSFNAVHSKGQTQARTEEWMEAIRATPNEQKDLMSGNTAQAQLSSNSAQAQLSANSANQHSAHQEKQEATSFLQQTGEKMVHMAQDAVDTVKETLGMSDKK